MRTPSQGPSGTACRCRASFNDAPTCSRTPSMPDDDKPKPGFLPRLFGRGQAGDMAPAPEPAIPAEVLDPIAEAASFESVPPPLPVEPAASAPRRSWLQRLTQG